MSTLLITGGAGFIGSALIRLLIAESDYRVVNVDKLTYAGNLANLAPVADDFLLRVVEGDILDRSLVQRVIGDTDAVVHFAAE